jgi:DNA repair photolyase
MARVSVSRYRLNTKADNIKRALDLLAKLERTT